jgi:5-methylcytosine-specific restriction enzyme A
MPQRIRGRALQERRARLLRAHPLCVWCERRGVVALATALDHIVALTNGGADDESNLQGLCAECHRQKTAADLGTRARDGCDANGLPLRADHPWNADEK